MAAAREFTYILDDADETERRSTIDDQIFRSQNEDVWYEDVELHLVWNHSLFSWNLKKKNQFYTSTGTIDFNKTPVKGEWGVRSSKFLFLPLCCAHVESLWSTTCSIKWAESIDRLYSIVVVLFLLHHQNFYCHGHWYIKWRRRKGTESRTNTFMKAHIEAECDVTWRVAHPVRLEVVRKKEARGYEAMGHAHTRRRRYHPPESDSQWGTSCFSSFCCRVYILSSGGGHTRRRLKLKQPGCISPWDVLFSLRPVSLLSSRRRRVDNRVNIVLLLLVARRVSKLLTLLRHRNNKTRRQDFSLSP